MYRARLASLALAASLGLACGCTSLCDHPLFGGDHSLFGRRDNAAPCATPTAGCSTCGSVVSDTVVSEGPILESTPGVVGGPPMITPESTVPPLGQPPRLVPQAAPTPYTPTMRQIP